MQILSHASETHVWQSEARGGCDERRKLRNQAAERSIRGLHERKQEQNARQTCVCVGTSSLSAGLRVFLFRPAMMLAAICPHQAETGGDARDQGRANCRRIPHGGTRVAARRAYRCSLCLCPAQGAARACSSSVLQEAQRGTPRRGS